MTDVSADAGIVSAEPARCEVCGEPMPPGEQMFKYHGFSCECPKAPAAKSLSPRQQQNRDAQARRRARRRLKVVMRTIPMEHEWLDALEALGYLNPWDRTIAEAEVDAAVRFFRDWFPRATRLGGKNEFGATRRD